jgi:hypothetical protein
LIIAILLLEFVQSGPIRTGVLKFQLKVDSGEEPGKFCESQLAGTSIFEGIECSPTDAGLARQLGLAELELLAMFGYLSPYRD